ncbi:hypothetical protein PHYBOEH_009416 [Phytophthora boehmeriae]|uniref:START domain-containing protein n=1 Tax=Phytophthora boehmeriae TaxID=109152 RepID=A0A8T1VSZ2_9STRA|nr:hypothetical protein PHYBOEH_009416 [Phytophthora boehmeriae]
MNRRFPIPRASLPQPNVSDLEHKASKQIMHQLLTHTLREFEQYAYRYSGGVDARRWKKQSSRDDLTVYRERKAGETGASVFDSLRECRLDLPTFSSTVETLASPTMLLTGLGPGRVEDAMSAIVTENQQDLALVVKYKHQDVADCAIVKTIEPPTQSEPYKYLGYKFFVRKSPTDGRLMKHRHSLYLEYCGMTHTSTGERIGFHIMHSVELPQFPDLTSYNSIRALQSTRYLFRQKSDRVVEVFMLGNMDIAGRMFKPLANMFTVETLVGVTRLLDLAEVRRLSQMAREQRRYGSRKCTTSKRVFISDEMGILGDFKKSDMMSRLFELSKMAEATSTTTHLNGIYCEQHWREELKVEMEAIGSPELLRPVKTWV